MQFEMTSLGQATVHQSGVLIFALMPVSSLDTFHDVNPSFT